jgi:hypothetical protein
LGETRYRFRLLCFSTFEILKLGLFLCCDFTWYVRSAACRSGVTLFFGFASTGATPVTGVAEAAGISAIGPQAASIFLLPAISYNVERTQFMCQ